MRIMLCKLCKFQFLRLRASNNQKHIEQNITVEEFDDLEATELEEAEADPSVAIRVRFGVQSPLSGFGCIPL